MKDSIYDIEIFDIDGNKVNLSQYRNKYMLIVNVASKCGFTNQYQGLQEIYKEFEDKVVVLGFPCNQFGAQEPGDEKEIKNFCSLSYDVTFPMFQKIDVNGPKASPLFQHLKTNAPGIFGSEFIKWNFTKFLIHPNESKIERYSPQDKPEILKKRLNQINS